MRSFRPINRRQAAAPWTALLAALALIATMTRAAPERGLPGDAQSIRESTVTAAVTDPPVPTRQTVQPTILARHAPFLGWHIPLSHQRPALARELPRELYR